MSKSVQLDALLAASGKNVPEVAAAAGIGERTIRRYLAGQVRNPHRREVGALAEALHVDFATMRDAISAQCASPPTEMPPPLAPTDAATRRQLLLGSIAASLDWLAWRIWQRKGAAIHESDVPQELLASMTGHPHVLRDREGYLSFANPGMVEATIAQHVFDDMGSGSDLLLSTAQTTHTCDLRIGQLVAGEEDVHRSLEQWMRDGYSPILRVNAAGVLAKTNGGQFGDRVLTSLRDDDDTRDLYVTAVASRVLSIPWAEATELARLTGSNTPLLSAWSTEQRTAAVTRLSKELSNPRDVGARFCSALLLHGLADAAPDIARQGLGRACQDEPCTENLRAFALTLAGHPILTRS